MAKKKKPDKEKDAKKTADKKKSADKKVDDKKKDNAKKTDDKRKDTTKKKRLKDFPEHMSIKQFVDETGFTVNAVWQMILEGELYSVIDENGQRLIPSFQIGRFIDLDK
jgi:hypothetical protein